MKPTDGQLNAAYDSLFNLKGYIMCPHCYQLHYPIVYVQVGNGKTSTFVNVLAWKDLKCLKCNKELYKIKDDRLVLANIDELIAGFISTLNRLGYKTKFSCSGHIGHAPTKSEYYLEEVGNDTYIHYQGTPYVVFEKEYPEVKMLVEQLKTKQRFKRHIELQLDSNGRSFGIYGTSSDSFRGDYLVHIVAFRNFLKSLTMSLYKLKTGKLFKENQMDLVMTITKENMKR